MTLPADLNVSRPVLSGNWYIGPTRAPPTPVYRNARAKFRWEGRKRSSDKENRVHGKRKSEHSLSSHTVSRKRPLKENVPIIPPKPLHSLSNHVSQSKIPVNRTSNFEFMRSSLNTHNWRDNEPTRRESVLEYLSVSKSSPGRLTISIPYAGDARLSGDKLPVLKSTETLSSILSRNGISSTTETQNLDSTPRTEPADDAQALILSDDAVLDSNEYSLDAAGTTSSQPTDDLFGTLQTPTKVLSESDQMSFHLSSPPAVLRHLVSGFRSSDRGDTTFAEPRTFCTRLFDTPLDPGTYRPPIHRLSSISSHPRTSTSSNRKLNDDNCLAVLTAKATVWNRPLTRPQPTPSNPDPIKSSNFTCGPISRNDLTKKQPHGRVSRTISELRLNIPKLPPLPPLHVPPRTQPHLSIRRVLQVNSERAWRKFAFGMSNTHANTIQLARQFLNASQTQCVKHEESTPADSLLSSLNVVIKPEAPDYSLEHLNF